MIAVYEISDNGHPHTVAAFIAIKAGTTLQQQLTLLLRHARTIEHETLKIEIQIKQTFSSREQIETFAQISLHEEEQIPVVVHGDDFVMLANDSDITRLEAELAKRVEICDHCKYGHMAQTCERSSYPELNGAHH